MIENVPSDLQDQMIISESSFVEVRSRPLKRPQQRSPIRSEDEITIKSLAIGTLLSGAAFVACVVAWYAVLIAPIWGLSTLLF